MSDLPTLVLTGASAGIGLAALEVLQETAFVLAVSRTKPPLARFNGCWIQGDLQRPKDVVANIKRRLRGRGNALDGIIHCAVSYGSHQRHDLLSTTDDEWAEVMAVNVHSQFILTTRLLPLLLSRPQAFIVSLTSDAAATAAPRRIAYGCSKAASYALFSGLAAELAGSTVSVIQMLPRQQVMTRGIRRRRPPDFDFSGYSSPDLFKQPFKSILSCRGAGMNGTRLTV